MSGAWPGERARHGGVDRVPLPGPAGSLWLCGKHFIGPDHAAATSQVGAGVVVCLCRAPELADRYPEYLAWLEAGGDRDGPDGVEAVWSAVDDLHAPAWEAALELVSTIRHHLDAGRGVLMHCGAGIGRAGTIAVAVLMSFGMERSEALRTVADSRPLAGPEVGAQSELLDRFAGHFRPT